MKKALLSLLISISAVTASTTQIHSVPFDLPDLYQSSRTISNADFKGKIVLLNLWASWCGGCQKEMPMLRELQKEFSKKNFVVVLVNIDNDMRNAKEFLSDVDNSRVLTCVYDHDKKLAKAYKVIGMPSSYLIDENGKVIEVLVGTLDKEALLSLKDKIKKHMRGAK
ncbi:TlpA family protein disulfide reductase [Sulfurimonas sp.]